MGIIEMNNFGYRRNLNQNISRYNSSSYVTNSKEHYERRRNFKGDWDQYNNKYSNSLNNNKRTLSEEPKTWKAKWILAILLKRKWKLVGFPKRKKVKMEH